MSCVSRPTWYTNGSRSASPCSPGAGPPASPRGEPFPSAEEPIAPAKFVSTRWTISVSLSRHDAVLDRPVDLARQGGRAEQNVGVPPLAPAVVRPVPRRELVDERSREFPFPVHEDPLVRYEDIFEDQRALPADHPPLRAAVDRSVLLLPLVVALAAEDERKPRRVDRDGAGDRVVGPLRQEARAWASRRISWEFAAPVMCVLAPRITIRSGPRSTT